MSFDVSLRSPSCDHCRRGGEEVYSFNLTHNVNDIVDACLRTDANGPVAKEASHYAERSWGRLVGWTAADALPFLLRALAEVRNADRKAEFKAMEPSNGWGDRGSVERVLVEFVAMCRQYPEATIHAWG